MFNLRDVSSFGTREEGLDNETIQALLKHAQNIFLEHYVCLYAILTFLKSMAWRNSEAVDSVQIHHVPGHWATSYAARGQVTVCDSKFTGKAATQLKHQLARIYGPDAATYWMDTIFTLIFYQCSSNMGVVTVANFLLPLHTMQQEEMVYPS